MEEMIDFDTWLKNYKPEEVQYMVTFDPMTGAILSVGPSHAFENEKYKLFIDSDTAEKIIDGIIKISSCVIDVESSELEISEVITTVKIDDVVHRIVEKEFAENDKFDIYLTFNRKNKSLKIEMSEEYKGTKKLPKKCYPIAKRRILWDGETEMSFLLTDYNDPNYLYQMVTVKLSDILGKSKTIKDLDLPPKFSIYTRRLFKNYILEIK